MSLLALAFTFTTLLTTVSAHGHVIGIVADGTWYRGYLPPDQFLDPVPSLIAWSTPQNWDGGPIGPVNYTDPLQINCHRNSTPGASSAKVSAGSVVNLQWSHWPHGHHGPVLDYMAKCPGSCSEVDQTTLEWFMISNEAFQAASDKYPLGWWATSDLNNNNDSWSVVIPPTIAPGNYVLRHEIIALHVAGDLDGAQNYPQCVNLEVTSDGSDEPAGVKGTELYQPTDPGISINIWMQAIKSYTMPGPTLYSGATKYINMTQSTLQIKNLAPSTPTGTTAASSPASSDATPTPQRNVAATPPSPSTPTPTPAISTPTTTPTPTPSFTYAPSSPSSSPSSAPSPSDSCTHPTMADATSQIAKIASAVPSGYLTSTVDDTAPSPASPPGATATAEYQWGDLPSKSIPAGYTLKDFLEWTAYTVKKAWDDEERVHQRDFVGAMV